MLLHSSCGIPNYDVELGKKKVAKDDAGNDIVPEVVKKSRHILATIKKRQAVRHLDALVAD